MQWQYQVKDFRNLKAYKNFSYIYIKILTSLFKKWKEMRGKKTGHQV